MTIWNSTDQKRDECESALRSIAALERTLLTEEQARSPEWSAVMEALEEQRRLVVSIGLEVLASHYKQELPASTRQLLETLADSLRASQYGKTKALVELMARSQRREERFVAA